ncbi:hypothetical protein AB0M11_20845 [Streptomyces sp. NPDC051987]|uniref:hypothetical protein n=1 Tax=Streptomyces sp. NPDC051987 TaxID=3155808 RepID=UPI00341A3ABC
MTDDARGLLVDLLSVLGSLDQAFVSWRRDGVRSSTAQTLDWFWEQPEAAALRAVAERPPLEWDVFVDALLDLGTAGSVVDGTDWADLAAEAQRRTGRDLVAAGAVSLCALAGWLGSCGERLLRFPPAPGWYEVPARTASALLSADAVHAAELLTRRARQFVEMAELDIYQPALQERLVPLREVAAGIVRRRGEDMADLAWDLRDACGRTEPHLRPELAALFWTVGDVLRAYLVARDTGYVPALDIVQDLVTITMARVRDDPLLQYVWLAMKDRPPLDLRRHHRLFALLNAVYLTTPAHEVDRLLPSGPISRIYAETLIAYFGDGPSEAHRADFAAAWPLAQAMLGNRDPLVELRLASLFNLLLSEDHERPDRWLQLARMATDILRAAVQGGSFTAYHRCLALPAFYLPQASDAPERAAQAAVEEHRAVGLHYWLTAAPPPPPQFGVLAKLLPGETQLLDRLRAARFVRHTDHLPQAYQRFTVDLRKAVRHGPPDTHRLEPDTHPLGQERAAQTIVETWEHLSALWERMREVDSDYADLRTNPVVQLDGFAHALTATTPPDPPVGPTPIRRRGPMARPDAALRTPTDPVPAEDPDERAVHRMRAAELGATADRLVEQYHREPDLSLLDRAIPAAAEACRLVEEGGEDHLRHLDRLAMIRAGRYLHARERADIDAAIADHEAAAAFAEADHIPVPLRVMLRFNAGMTVHHRYEQAGTVDDLRRAIEHWRTAARTPGIPQEQAMTLFHAYTHALHEMYGHTQDPTVLAERITAQRAAVDLAPQDPNHVGYLAGLALQVMEEHRTSENPALLAEAVELLRQAARLARQSDPRNLLPVLNNLALALLVRHAEGHDDADFDHAVAALDEAAAIAPLGPTRRELLTSLADLLEQRHAQRGDPADAERAALVRSQAADMHGR